MRLLLSISPPNLTSSCHDICVFTVTEYLSSLNLELCKERTWFVLFLWVWMWGIDTLHAEKLCLPRSRRVSPPAITTVRVENGALRVTICEFIGISCYTRASVSKARPTTHPKKEAALESEWFSMKRFGTMLAPSSRSAVGLYCCRWLKLILWDSGHHNLTCSRQSFFLAWCMSLYCKTKNHMRSPASQAIHKPFEVSERAWREVFLKQTSTNMASGSYRIPS